MKSALIVTLFTFLRLGIPLITMLLVGEAVRHHSLKVQKRHGA